MELRILLVIMVVIVVNISLVIPTFASIDNPVVVRGVRVHSRCTRSPPAPFFAATVFILVSSMLSRYAVLSLDDQKSLTR